MHRRKTIARNQAWIVNADASRSSIWSKHWIILHHDCTFTADILTIFNPCFAGRQALQCLQKHWITVAAANSWDIWAIICFIFEDCNSTEASFKRAHWFLKDFNSAVLLRRLNFLWLLHRVHSRWRWASHRTWMLQRVIFPTPRPSPK